MCETACSFYHTGSINRHTSRIKVENLYGIGIDGPIVCVQCKEKYCMDCPADAIRVGQDGQIIVTPTLCTLCEKCEENCPIGAIEIFNDIVFVCDLCGGSPKCVVACTENAIDYKPDKKMGISLEKVKEETETMNPSEKRVHFAKKMGKKLRTDWGK